MEHMSIDEIVPEVLWDQAQETIQTVINKVADDGEYKKGLELIQRFHSRVGIKFCLKGTLQLGRDQFCKRAQEMSRKEH